MFKNLINLILFGTIGANSQNHRVYDSEKSWRTIYRTNKNPLGGCTSDYYDNLTDQLLNKVGVDGEAMLEAPHAISVSNFRHSQLRHKKESPPVDGIYDNSAYIVSQCHSQGVKLLKPHEQRDVGRIYNFLNSKDSGRCEDDVHFYLGGSDLNDNKMIGIGVKKSGDKGLCTCAAILFPEKGYVLDLEDCNDIQKSPSLSPNLGGSKSEL